MKNTGLFKCDCHEDIPNLIQWHEGMLLSPQHFQKLSNRSEALLIYHLHHIEPYYWGIINIEYDQAQLESGVFQLSFIEAILPDGLTIYYNSRLSDEQLEFEFKKYMEEHKLEKITIHLSVASQDLNAINKRFHSLNLENVEDMNESRNKVNIPVLKPRLTLVPDNILTKAVAHIPIIVIELKNNTYNKKDFMPPTILLHQDNIIIKQCKKIAENIRNNTINLKNKYINLSKKSHDIKPYGLLTKIQVLSEKLPLLDLITNSNGTHPYKLYMILSEIAGKIAIYNPEISPPSFPLYDHNDALKCFRSIFNYIETTLKYFEERYSTIVIHSEDFSFKIKSDYIHPNEPLIVGIQVINRPESEVAKWMDTAFIASESKIDETTKNRVLGAKRKQINVYQPYHLISPPGVILYQIDCDENMIINPDETLIIHACKREEDLAMPSTLLLYMCKK